MLLPLLAPLLPAIPPPEYPIPLIVEAPRVALLADPALANNDFEPSLPRAIALSLF